MSVIDSLASNACQCLQGDLDSALNNITQKANTGAAKLAEMVTGPLNNPIDAINNTVLDAQHALATGFESQVKGLMSDITGGAVAALNSSCFLQPFADFFGQVNGLVGQLAGIIGGLDLSLPTLNLNFQIALHVNVCGGADTFSGPLASAFGAAGLSLNGTFPIAGAFLGMNFPDVDYAAKFQAMVGSVVNIGNMEKMVDSVLDAVDSRISDITGQITDGIDAVKNWGENAAKTVNGLVDAAKDPSAALSAIAKSVVPPGAVAWATKFAGLFGFGPPKVFGGDTPKKPRDVNYLTNKAVGQKINDLLQANALVNTPSANAGFLRGVADALFSGFHAATEDELGAELKKVMGMEDSTVSNTEFARAVKKEAGEMGVEGLAAAAHLPNEQVHEFLAEATQQRSEEEHRAIAEGNPDLTAANKLIADHNADIARGEQALAEARELRPNPKLTVEDRAEVDKVIADLDRNLTEQRQGLPRLIAARDAVERDVLGEGPRSSSEPLSEVAGARPASESRFSSLTPTPGAGERTETVTTLSGSGTSSSSSAPTTLAEIASQYDEQLAKSDRIIIDSQITIKNNEEALAIARDIRSTEGLNAEDKAEIDKEIASINRSQKILQDNLAKALVTNAQILRNQAELGPPSSDAKLSSLVAPPGSDSRLAALASSQSGAVLQNTPSVPRETESLSELSARQQQELIAKETAQHGPGSFYNLTKTQIENLTPERRESIRALQASHRGEFPSNTSGGTSEVVIQRSESQMPVTPQDVLRNPGIPAASTAREAAGGPEELTRRAIAATEALAVVPPKWLKQFIETGLAPQ